MLVSVPSFAALLDLVRATDLVALIPRRSCFDTAGLAIQGSLAVYDGCQGSVTSPTGGSPSSADRPISSGPEIASW